MSITLTRSPSEDPETIRRLLHANLFLVFAERSVAARTAAIADIYHDEILWHEPDRLVHGKEDLNTRAGDILADAPGFEFTVDGDYVVSQNMGILRWNFGPNTQRDLVKGTDVILVEGGKVKVLWTAVTKAP